MIFGPNSFLRRLIFSYVPLSEARSFMARAQTQTVDNAEVTVAVLDSAESRQFFGVPMARRGIQPIWMRIVNHGDTPLRLDLVRIDPNYYTPLEAAGANHFSTGKRLLAFGFLAILFVPFILLLLLKLIGASLANRKMYAYFQGHAFRLRPVPPGGESSGFVYMPFDVGIKIINIRLLGPRGANELVFSATVPGLNADYLRRNFQNLYSAADLIECDAASLRQHLTAAPATTTNRRGARSGNPANLVIIGDFPLILAAFGARWNETETITLATCGKTLWSFLFGRQYRYSPVSFLYLYGRSQDFALQRIRQSINDRLHLRLWATPLRFNGQPVWIGQVSRDIGVRFTFRTWNLTTHRVNPDVDEAREYVIEDLLQAERVDRTGYVDGVGACEPESPRRNLTGDPYFTDGKRAVIVVSPGRATARFFDWP